MAGYVVTITSFDIEPGTDRNILAQWTFRQPHVAEYKLQWEYDNGSGIWIIGNEGSTIHGQASYEPPEHAKRVRLWVKPISETYDVNGVETSFWVGDWAPAPYHNYVVDPKPVKPDTPSVEIDIYKLTARLDNIPYQSGKYIEFEVVKDDLITVITNEQPIVTNTAIMVVNVEGGSFYKVRARAFINQTYSEWSEYAANVASVPLAPSELIYVKATSKTSVMLEWTAVNSASSYTVQYTDKIANFDTGLDLVEETGITTVKKEIGGLESGTQYFFRVKAVNDQGESNFTDIKSVIIGVKPEYPTTWSSSTTAMVGEQVTLYWIHNTEDGSKATSSQLERTINGRTDVITIQNTKPDDDDSNHSYVQETQGFVEGTDYKWRVRTAGITGEYGPWSIMRTLSVYAPPTLTMNITNNVNVAVSTITSFPIKVKSVYGPYTQKPTGYHLRVISKEGYTIVDSTGNSVVVRPGTVIYSKYINSQSNLDYVITAHDIDLESNRSYEFVLIASMNSGLTAEATKTINVRWSSTIPIPNAEIGVSKKDLTARIAAFCKDDSGAFVPNIELGIFRREYDGSMIMVADKLPNIPNTFVIDPHPALDWARYRIVATSTVTGLSNYYDMPGYPVNDHNIVIQWDEVYHSFDATNTQGNILSQAAWNGSMLKLPYNIDINDQVNMDVEMVNYTGRKRPVSYYGTHVDETATWNTVIPKTDVETIYALRRLSQWTGDVYVREPGGGGYWANVTLSIDTKHNELTIPISFNITRVEGGL